MFISRNRKHGRSRWTTIRVGLFFLGAGVWVAGMLVDRSEVTGLAIAIVLLGLLLGIVERRQEDVEEVESSDAG